MLDSVLEEGGGTGEQISLLPTFWANFSLLPKHLSHIFSLLPILFLPPPRSYMWIAFVYYLLLQIFQRAPRIFSRFGFSDSSTTRSYFDLLWCSVLLSFELFRHFLNERKSGYDLRPQGFLGSFEAEHATCERRSQGYSEWRRYTWCKNTSRNSATMQCCSIEKMVAVQRS